MTRKEIVEQIAVLLESEDVMSLGGQIKELKGHFNEELRKEHADQLKKFVDDGGQEADFKVPHDEHDARFMDLMTDYRQRRKKAEEEKIKQEEQNLLIKRKVIEDLNRLIKEEQNIGKAFAVFKELQETWKSTGNVSATSYRELQHQYSMALEEFFYNINIYKTLKEYDLKKNHQLKVDLINKVKALVDHPSITETRELIKSYVQEWDEIGPTEKDKWEAIRDEFWENTRAVYKRVQEHYKGVKENQAENLEKKTALCEKVEVLNEVEYTTAKKWSQKTKEIEAIRTEWKNYGFAGKKDNDSIWKRFRTAVDTFYDRRRAFNSKMKDVYGDHAIKKEKLIEEAEELKDHTDWKVTTDRFIKLQKRWKAVGSADPHLEQKLWKRFRACCDHFFNAKKHFYDTREEREGNNLKLKEELLEKLKAHKVEGEQEEITKSLDQFVTDWNAIGFVPMKEKSRLNTAFDELLGAQMKAAGLDPKKVEKEKFRLKVEGMRSADNSKELLRTEMLHMEDKMRKLEAEIKQYENNLGFIGGNREGNPLVMEVEKKIENSRKRLDQIKERIKMLRY